MYDKIRDDDMAGVEAPRLLWVDYPSWEPDEIAPRLFMGGTHDDDTIDIAADLAGLGAGGAKPFDAVLTLYAWARPVSWDVEELRYGFGDGALSGTDLARLLRAAQWGHARWQAGDRVLVRCQAGLNRSGLVTALILMRSGMSSQEAVRLIRAKRSPHALFNPHFVRWLHEAGPGLIAGR